MIATLRCSVCGGSSFVDNLVLWPKLIAEWQLSPAETTTIDRQQGTNCTSCGSNLRSIALSDAILSWANSPPAGTLQAWVASDHARNLRVLEINEAGTLSPTLAALPGHVLAAYPAVDIHALPYDDASFDLVVHSDTLEHVPRPIHALVECRRVLKPGGALCYTVPAVMGRLTHSRAGMPLSFHGSAANQSPDYAVQTEFGADAWTYPVLAGFKTLTIHTLDFPCATAILARRED